MTTQELLDFFRGMHGDSTLPPYYSDTFLVMLANEAQKEAARRTRCFIDSVTPDLCVFAVTAGDRFVERDPRIIFIRNVRIASRQDFLWKIRYQDLDNIAPDWHNEDPGVPTHYCTDYQTGRVYFHYPFETDDTVTLTVIREPLAPMDLVSVDPEIPARWQEKLAHWMAYRAFNTSDLEDKYEPAKAKVEYALFEAEFGPPSKAIDEQWEDTRHGYDPFEGQF
jgi:hypothetical protein